MKKSRQLGAACVVVFTLFTVTANAAFTGRLPTIPRGSDWQSYYDGQLYITCEANANINPHESA